MKKLALLVFAAAVLAASPDPTPSRATQLPAVEGEGLFSVLACGACIGAGVTLSATGLGSFYAALMAAGDGALAESCLSACTF